MGNAILGSALILGISSVIGVPLGIGAGIYLSEYGHGRLATLVRFIADVLNGVPSIVMGIAVYALVVLRQKHFSALAGRIALGIMMIPTITRTSEEMLLMVPRSYPRGGAGIRGCRMAGGGLRDFANRAARGNYRHHAGVCPGGGGDRAAVVYRVWQSILE